MAYNSREKKQSGLYWSIFMLKKTWIWLFPLYKTYLGYLYALKYLYSIFLSEKAAGLLDYNVQLCDVLPIRKPGVFLPSLRTEQEFRLQWEGFYETWIWIVGRGGRYFNMLLRIDCLKWFKYLIIHRAKKKKSPGDPLQTSDSVEIGHDTGKSLKIKMFPGSKED